MVRTEIIGSHQNDTLYQCKIGRAERQIEINIDIGRAEPQIDTNINIGRAEP